MASRSVGISDQGPLHARSALQGSSCRARVTEPAVRARLYGLVVEDRRAATANDAPVPAGNVDRAPRPLVKVTEGTTAVAVVGFVLYAILRVAYVRFYAPFGLSPDDLGLGYIELIAQSAIGALMLLLTFGTFIVVPVAVWIDVVASSNAPWVARMRARLTGHARVAAAVGAALFVVITVLELVGLFTAQRRLAYPGLALTAAFVGALFARGLRLGWRGVRGGGEQPVNRWRVGVGAIALVATALTAFTLAGVAARDDARAVAAGYATHPTLWGVRPTSWGAQAATLTWTRSPAGGPLAALSTACVMYLGQSNGTLFLFVPFAPGPATFRVPAGLAIIRISGRRCARGAHAPS